MTVRKIIAFAVIVALAILGACLATVHALPNPVPRDGTIRADQSLDRLTPPGP